MIKAIHIVISKTILEQFRDGTPFDLIYHGDRQRVTVMGHQGPGLIWVATEKRSPLVLREDGSYNSTNAIRVEPVPVVESTISWPDQEVDPVAEYQCRTQPVGDGESQWSDWMKCSKTTYDAIRNRVTNTDQLKYEVRALCVQPIAPSKLIRVRFEDNSLVEWDDSIPDGTYLLGAPIAP